MTSGVLTWHSRFFVCCLFFSAEDHFLHACEGDENRELRFHLCHDLWDKVKTNTEVRPDIQHVG